MTTSATDALLAIECVVITAWLWCSPACDRWRSGLWCWVFGLLGFSSLLGAVAHGFEIPAATRQIIWRPLYLSLGVLVALFVVGAVYDWRGRDAAGRLIPWAIAAGAAFFVLTVVFRGPFILFIAYEAVAMIGALTIYTYLALSGRLAGAGLIAAAIVLNLAAAAVQASPVSIRLLVPLDHNGIFHLVQMAGAALLGLGLLISCHPAARQDI